MSRRRRLVLQSLAAALAALPQIGNTSDPRSAKAGGRTEQALRALLDTLVPADETPSATAVGVHHSMMELAGRDAPYRKLLDDGAAWLDAAARTAGARSFHEATEPQRIAIVQQAERSRARSFPRRFFDEMRRDTLFLYYSHPAAWPSLGYTGPPQPIGFPDFDRAPRKRA